MGHFITQLCTTLHPACAAALGGFSCFDLQGRFEPACVELTETEALQSTDLTAEKHSQKLFSFNPMTPQQAVPIKSYNTTSPLCAAAPQNLWLILHFIGKK